MVQIMVAINGVLRYIQIMKDTKRMFKELGRFLATLMGVAFGAFWFLSGIVMYIGSIVITGYIGIVVISAGYHMIRNLFI